MGDLGLSATEELRDRLSVEPTIASVVGALTVDAEAVSSRAPYFSGRVAGGDDTVIVRVAVAAVEAAWAPLLADLDPPLGPVVYGTGRVVVGGTEVLWLMQSRHRPTVWWDWRPEPLERLVEGGARFHQFARHQQAPLLPPFDRQVVAEWLSAGHSRGLDTAAWAETLDEDWAFLEGHAETTVIMGDLHPGNVLAGHRAEPLLVGMCPRWAPWVFDAVWVETHHLFNDLFAPPLHLVEYMDDVRSRLGLPGLGSSRARVAQIARAWCAAQVWSLQDDQRRADRRRLDRALSRLRPRRIDG